MKAAALVDFESGLAVREVPAPEPAAGELLVRVRAASVGNVDVLIAGGVLRGMMEYVFPVIPGRDFAGRVERVGDGVTAFAAGDEVLGWFMQPVLHEGTWAEYAVVAESGFVARRPAGLDVVQAAALPLAAMTAHALVEAVAAAPGTKLLVVGAGGGVGVFAVQLAARCGAAVIATARPGDERRLRELGAAETVDYTSGDLAAAVRERHPRGIDGVIDVVNRSPEELAPLAALVRDGGAVASAIGAAAAEGRSVTATNVVAQALDPAVLREVVALAGTGELRVPVEAVYPLEEAPAAVAAFAAGKRGKLVLTVPG